MPRELSLQALKLFRKAVCTTSLHACECEYNFSATNDIKKIKKNSLNIPTKPS
jgi:acetoin utilization deacetylase AcuC-like enzyme